LTTVDGQVIEQWLASERPRFVWGKYVSADGQVWWFDQPDKDKGLSVRVYVKALEAKEASEDWREYVLKQYVKGPDLDFLVLEADPYFKQKSTEERCRAWMSRTGKARSTYFERKRSLLERLSSEAVPPPLVGRLTLEGPDQDTPI
jgi:hypothetical protein